MLEMTENDIEEVSEQGKYIMKKKHMEDWH